MSTLPSQPPALMLTDFHEPVDATSSTQGGDSDAVRAQFDAMFATWAVRPETLAGDRSASITPRLVGAGPAERARALPCLTLTTDPEVPPELALGRTLGKGGMGVVRAAHQPALGREIAVKQVMPEQRGDSASDRLLQEAMITGLLEHPGVIPVHTLGRDEHDQPLMAMKKLNGLPWSTLLDDANHPLLRDDPREPLDFHLDALVHVAHAVHFAHTHGIIHRDLKPDNVMIGSFGEVIVLDWGVAVSTRFDPSGVLPHAPDTRGLAGTPAWMAPEMVEETGERIGVHTDVYLLGALLYTVLTGEPPHDGETVYESLYRAWRNTPKMPEDVPPVLLALCERAMHTNPAERHTSAEHFRLELQAWQRQRPARELAARVADEWARLKPLLTLATENDEARRRVRVHFGACQAAGELALHAWPEIPGVSETLHAATEAMARLALHRGDLGGAEFHVAALTQPSQELVQGLEVLQSQHRIERVRLAKLDWDSDRSVGAGARSGMALALGVVWTAVPLLTWIAQRGWGYELTSTGQLFTGGLFAAMAMAAVWKLRAGLFANELNRQVLMGGVVTVVLTFIGRLAAAVAGLEVANVTLLNTLVFGSVLAMLAATVDWRLVFSAATYAIAALCIAAWPIHALPLIAGANLVALGLIAWLWRPEESTRAGRRRRRAEASAVTSAAIPTVGSARAP